MKLREKTTATLLIVLLTSMAFGLVPVLAVKPTEKLTGAENILWYLSADIMPVPPYGSLDIPGSDVASKLILNQPNGAVEVTLTGVMKGLNPSTTYTVYLAPAYSLNVKRWSLTGSWTLRFIFGGNWDHDMTVTIQDSSGLFSGSGGYPASGPPYSHDWTVSGTVTGNSVSFHIEYLTGNPGYTVDATGTISAIDGSMSGAWSSNTGQSGSWSSISGAATYTLIGTGWSGIFTSTIQPFPFITEQDGSGSWHLNLRDSDFPGSGTYHLSVWINVPGVATILISENFMVTVD